MFLGRQKRPDPEPEERNPNRAERWKNAVRDSRFRMRRLAVGRRDAGRETSELEAADSHEHASDHAVPTHDYLGAEYVPCGDAHREMAELDVRAPATVEADVDLDTCRIDAKSPLVEVAVDPPIIEREIDETVRADQRIPRGCRDDPSARRRRHGDVVLDASRVQEAKRVTGLGRPVARRTTPRGPRPRGGSHVDVARVEEDDLADPVSVSGFASRWLESGRPLHVLINNAKSKPSKEVVRDSRGYEQQFATGHLGHFQLTLALLPALRAAGGARVVNVSSGAQRFGQIRWDDLHFAADYSPTAAYAQVKKANVLFAVELDRRWKAEKIRGYAVHPGVIIHANTTVAPEALRSMGLLDESGKPIIDPEHGKKTLAQGISTIVFAATSPLLDGLGGVYLKDNDISRIDDELTPLTADSIPSEVSSSSIDPHAAERLWEVSERLLRA